MKCLYPYLVILIGICVLFSSSTFGQGTSCANAVNIGGLPYTSPNGLFATSHTTCGAGNDYGATSRCGNIYMDGEDFVYAFSPATNMCIDVDVTLGVLATNVTSVFVTEGCPDDVDGRCMAQGINPDGGGSSVTNVSLTAGKTYYIVVSSIDGECYAYTLNVNESATCPTPPTGFNCDYAEEINAIPYVENSTTCGHTSFMNIGNECYSTIYNQGPSYFYKYEAKATECIKIKGKTSGTTLRFSIHDTCPTFSDTTCQESFYMYGTEYTRYATLDSGKTYYFVISGSTCADYDFTFENITNEGVSCATAIDIDSVYFILPNQTTKCKGDYYEAEDDCSAFYKDGNEVVYKYESPGNECISASAFNMSTYGGIFLFEQCPNDPSEPILASDMRCSFNDPKEVGLEYNITNPGTYYILVAGRKYMSGSTTYYYDLEYDFRFSSVTIDDLGKDCQNIHVLSSSSSVVERGISVQCKGNEYTSADACDNPLIDGNDYVLAYTPQEDFCGTIFGRNTAGNGGLILMDACPDQVDANCLSAVACETECDSIYMDFTFEAGKTYYIIGASANGNFFKFDLEIKKANSTDDGCVECLADDCESCKNSDFELGSLERWEGYTGIYANPKQTVGLDSGNINDPLSRHTIMNAGAYDPVVGPALRTTGPLGGRYSHRLGNRSTGAQAEVLTYEFTVNNNTKNFFYYYAVVFEDPSHPVDEQPFFSVDMVAIDDNGSETTLGCAKYEVRPDPADPTFQETSNQLTGSGVIRWKDWTLVTIPLDAYIGQDVRLEFTTKDCDQSGHFGYAYIDAFCGDIGIGSNKENSYTICPGESVTLSAPDGFESYLWSTGESTKAITVTTAGNYTVVLTPFSDNPLLNCSVTLEQEVVVAEFPVASFDLDEGCNDAFVDFKSQSIGSVDYPLESVKWYFGDGSTSNIDSGFTHVYPGPGTYDVSIVAINEAKCKDSTSQQITINPYGSIGDVNAIDTIFICQFDSTQLFAEQYPDVMYEWEGPIGFTSTEREPFVVFNDTNQSGNYVVYVQLAADTCVYTYDTTFVQVVTFPEFSVSKDTLLCFTGNTTFLKATGGENYNWSPASVVSQMFGDSVIIVSDSTVEVKVEITNQLCPDSTMSVEVAIDYYKELLSLPDTFYVCEGDSLHLSVTGSPLANVEWKLADGSTYTDSIFSIPNATPSIEGYATITAFLGEAGYCEYDFDSAYVRVVAPPVSGIVDHSLTGCINTDLTFSGETHFEMEWIDTNGVSLSSSNTLIVPTQNSRFYYIFSNSLGCINRDTVFTSQINVIKPDLGNDRTFCLGDVKSIRPFNSFPPDYTYQWNSGEVSDSILVTTSSTVILTVTSQGCTNSDTVLITFQNPNAFNIGADTLLCSNDSLVMDFRGFGNSIMWQDGNTNFVRTIKSPGGLYEVTITSGACVLNDDINVSFEQLQTATLPANQVVCEGDTVKLMANPPGYTYEWKIDGTVIGPRAAIDIFEVGDFEIVLNANSTVCSTTDTTQVQVLSPNGLSLPDIHICETDSAFVDASIGFAGAIYLWNDGVTSPSRYCKNLGAYSVQITAGPCMVADTFDLTHDVVPVFSLGSDITICENDSVEIMANNENWPQYQWRQGEVGARKYAQLPAEYVLTATNGLCSFSDSIVVNTDNIPVFDLGDDQTICLGDSIQIQTGLSGTPVVWNTTETMHSIYAKDSGIYKAVVTNGTCTFTDSMLLTVQNPPVVDLGEDLILCSGDSVKVGFTLTGATYLWSTGEVADSILVKELGTYKLTVTEGVCAASDEVEVQFDVLNKPDLGDDRLYCNVILDTLVCPTTAQSFTWNTGDVGNVLPVSSPGVYIITAIQGTCIDKDTIELAVQPQHQVDVGVDSILCEGESYTLQGVTNAESPIYSWTNGETTANVTVSAQGWYTLSVQSGVCENSDSALIIVVPNPYINLDEDGKICEDDSVIIGDYVSHPDVAYNWSTGEIDSVIVAHRPGNYVEVARIAHCLQSDAYNLEVVTKPNPSLGEDVEVCADAVQLIGWQGNNVQYLWSTGDTIPFIMPSISGDYLLEVTRGPCKVQESIHVEIYPIPVQDFGRIEICPGDSLELEVTCTNCTAFWNETWESQTFVTYPGTFVELQVVSDFGCTFGRDMIIHTDPNCEDDVYIPNAFTPNGDKINDVFQPVCSELVEVISFSVFDRWGELVHYSKGDALSWNGYYLGSLCQDGTYNYTLVYRNRYRMKRVTKGVVNLLR